MIECYWISNQLVNEHSNQFTYFVIAKSSLKAVWKCKRIGMHVTWACPALKLLCSFADLPSASCLSRCWIEINSSSCVRLLLSWCLHALQSQWCVCWGWEIKWEKRNNVWASQFWLFFAKHWFCFVWQVAERVLELFNNLRWGECVQLDLNALENWFSFNIQIHVGWNTYLVNLVSIG